MMKMNKMQMIQAERQRAFTQWQHALACYQAGNIAQALVAIETAMVSAPNSLAHCLLHARIMIELGRFTEAKRSLSRLLPITRFHKNGRAQICKAWARYYEAQGRQRQAEQWYRKLTAVEPKSALAFTALANCLRKQAKLDEAELMFRYACKIEPHSQESALQLAILLRDGGKFDEAVSILRQGLGNDTPAENVAKTLDDLERAIQTLQNARVPGQTVSA